MCENSKFRCDANIKNEIRSVWQKIYSTNTWHCKNNDHWQLILFIKTEKQKFTGHNIIYSIKMYKQTKKRE